MKPITIIGGGLAGLTLGIGLRQRGIPVTVWESGRYPRHRVCGEFVSGRGQDALKRLGLAATFERAGAISARTATFVLPKGCPRIRTLPTPALCLSRFTMDAVLATGFRELGGELREHERWADKNSGEGFIYASGRQPQPVESGWRWFGLKVHARNVPLMADLEMHLSKDSYVGLCRLKTPSACDSKDKGSEAIPCETSPRLSTHSDFPIDPGETNICGLFRRRAATHDLANNWQELLRGAPDSPLRGRLTNALFDPASFCAVAGLSLRPQRATAQSECRIGDALTMIPPVTGNGMSMAFEAAELAMEPLAAYSRGELAWQSARAAVANACDRAFAKRLTWAKWLQWLMFMPAMRGQFGPVLFRSDWLWQMMFKKTR